MSDNAVRIVAHPHPFSPARRTMRDTLPGKSVAELVEEMGLTHVGRPEVTVSGERCPRAEWATTIPGAGSLVTIRVLPAGADGAQEGAGKVGGWAMVGVVLSIVLSPFTGGASLAFTPWLIGLAAAGFGTAFVIEANQQLGALLSGAPGTESTPSIRGGRNRAAPWGKVPIVLGKHLVVPLYGARPYTELGTESGGAGTTDIYLRQLFVVGYGPLRLSQFKIGESLLASNSAAIRNGAITIDGVFSGVDLEVYQDGTAPTLYPGVVLEDQIGVELKYGVETWRTTAPNVTRVSVDLALPRGLYKVDGEGALASRSVSVEVRRRAVGSGTAWASCTLVGTFTVTAGDSKPRWSNLAEDVTAGQYEIGMKRTTADDAEDYRGQSVTSWASLRSMRPSVAPIDAAIRSKLVIVALKIKASNQLQGVVDQLSCIAEADVPVYDGAGSGAAEWVTGISRNPAAQLLAVLRGNSNPRPVPDSAIDWARIESWYTTCATKGWTCDAVISSGARLRDTAQRIAQTGRASITLRDGLYSVVVDEAKVSPVQHFNPRNVRSFSWTKDFSERPHALRVNFISADDGYAPNERIVLDDGYKYDTDGDGVLRDWLGNDRTADGAYTVATKFRQVSLFGVTSAELAVKQARYLIACVRLRPEAFTFETDAEALVCEPGDLVRVAHDAIAVGVAAGRVVAVTVDGSGNATACDIDEEVTFETGKSYAARFRLADGSSVYATCSNAAGYEGQSLTFTTPIPAANVPAAGDLVSFGDHRDHELYRRRDRSARRSRVPPDRSRRGRGRPLGRRGDHTGVRFARLAAWIALGAFDGFDADHDRRGQARRIRKGRASRGGCCRGSRSRPGLSRRLRVRLAPRDRERGRHGPRILGHRWRARDLRDDRWHLDETRGAIGGRSLARMAGHFAGHSCGSRWRFRGRTVWRGCRLLRRGCGDIRRAGGTSGIHCEALCEANHGQTGG